MKVKIALLILSVFCLSSLVYAQKDVCKNIYVWDFTDENSKKNNLTGLITQEIESALTETACTVLQRRNYAQLAEQVENENAVQSIEGMSSTINEELQSIKAETVLFGQAKADFAGNIMLSVSFQSLLTKEILKSEYIFLTGEYAHNMKKRKEKIKVFIAHCVGPKVVSNQETSYWQNVQNLNTIEAYRTYLLKYPDGKYKSQAEGMLADEQRWQEIQNYTRKSRKINQLIKYTENPQRLHFAEARDQLEELLWTSRWDDTYKAHFPNGKYAAQMKERDAKRLYQLEESYYGYVVKSSGSLVFSKAAQYLAKFTNGKYTTKVEELVWGEVLSVDKNSEINSKESNAKEYLKLFANGKYAGEARNIVEGERKTKSSKPVATGDANSTLLRTFAKKYAAKKTASSLIGMAIAKKGSNVYSWYSNKTVASGSSKDLNVHRRAYSFTLPPNKSFNDVVGFAISANNKVYVWFKDGDLSVGSSANLYKDGKTYKYSLPPGKSPKNIVGMAISTKNNVYAWYDDGTVSAGTSRDLDSFRKPYRYSLPPGKKPADIVGMGISSAAKVYVWFSDGTVSAGSTKDLDSYRALYKYSR